MTHTGSIVRSATPKDYPAIAELLDGTFGKRPYGQRLKLWNWRFDLNPARTESFPSFLVVEEKSRIVGVHGLIPLRVKAGKQRLNASCSCDLAVDPSARSVGMKLKLATMDKKLSPLHLSTSANEPANKITLALGGREISDGRRKYIKPLKASGLMRRGMAGKGTAAGFAATASMLIWKPVDWILAIGRAVRPSARVEGSDVRNVTSFDVRFDVLWEELAKEHAILIVRDSLYLNWRYSGYPFPGIQSFGLFRGEQLLGFAVIHFSVDEDRLRFAAILELGGLKRESGVPEHLLEEAIRRAVHGGAHYLIAMATIPAYEDSLRRLGFRMREKSYSSITYKNNSDVPDEIFANDRNWYMTLGDGDGCYYFDPVP